MEIISLNKNWLVKELDSDNDYQKVNVPYDAMIFENTNEDAVTGKNGCWIETKDYEFLHNFTVDSKYQNSKIYLEFEGIYRNSRVFLNNQEISFRPYGYTNFYIDITDKIKFNYKNTIKVIAYNKDQPNNRWYSGTGIIRPVNLYLLPSQHIELNTLKVSTINYETRTIKVEFKTNAKGKVKVEVLDKDIVILRDDIDLENTSFAKEYSLPELDLWDTENPTLYQLRVTFKDDVQTTNFGIRQVELDLEKGFLLNGKRTILYGGCIHSENGMLGAITHPSIEERKVKLLKKAGFNALRCAHNPASKYFLDACDKYGMLVMDEYADCWLIHKTKYDYVNYLKDYWKEDLNDLINKDFNHPSVILYSLGNEVGESALKKGYELVSEFVSFVKERDNTRPTTCGVNLFYNFLTSIGVGFYNDEKAKKEELKNKKKKKKHKAVGSEFFNNLTNALGAPTLKFGAKFIGCDLATKEVYSRVDIAGYNYGILRYKQDLKKYPKRFIVGSETFCADANLFKKLVNDNPRIIGDFVWSGMDYLGEVGVGSWVHEDQTKDFRFGKGWLTAGSGRLDILGNQLPEMAYMRVCYGLDKIRIGVIPPKYLKMKHSTSSWKFSRAIESYSFSKEEINKDCEVEVYSQGKFVSLFLNKKLIKTKKVKKNAKTTFKIKYIPGELEAICYDENFKEIAKTSLFSSISETLLTLEAEKKDVKVGDYIYLNITLEDEKHNLKPIEDLEFSIKVGSQGKLVALGNACPYQPNGYHNTETKTYFGKAQAIVLAEEEGTLTISIKSKDEKLKSSVKVNVH